MLNFIATKLNWFTVILTDYNKQNNTNNTAKTFYFIRNDAII